jgi:hypothetical protein
MKKKQAKPPQLDPPDQATLDALFENLVEEFSDPIGAFDLLARLQPRNRPGNKGPV